ncbi:hypothetical protein EVG20_g1734 [Dentipellis fragilis]|uniref:Uncharacterized protein n=1 Tax=Dentipellis fragilis TaxID=205917 RepID=A0A4Y9Z9Z9_9AGAM|nr:hypothetical protein EVG20_g1734 [Dentipellis fragilis]
MGSSQSSISKELFLTAFVVAGALSFGYLHYTRSSEAKQAEVGPGGAAAGKKKQNKKKKTLSGTASDIPPAEAKPAAPPVVVAFPRVIPGEFEPSSGVEGEGATKAKKSKKKKGKKAAASADSTRLSPHAGAGVDTLSDSSASTTPVPPSKSKTKRTPPAVRQAPVELSSGDAPEEERWTRVEARKKGKSQPVREEAAVAAGAGKPSVSAIDTTHSDAGITTSVTGGSSPVTERTTEDELPKSATEEADSSTASLLNAPSVVRIRPQPGEKPAKGFTWEDYEGVQVDNNDADGEDDGGWGVVKSKGRNKHNQLSSSQQSHASKAPESLTKKQRQNAAKSEARKQAKQEAEVERLAILAQHKRDLERIKIAEQFGTKSKV